VTGSSKAAKGIKKKAGGRTSLTKKKEKREKKEVVGEGGANGSQRGRAGTKKREGGVGRLVPASSKKPSTHQSKGRKKRCPM